MRTTVLLALLLHGPVDPARETAAVATRDTTRCTEAARFVREVQGMVADVRPDTVDDWRTRQRLPGCRITASGVTATGVAAEAARLFDRLRRAGWTRSPDPRDAPNESSLRFRRHDVDCLFNVYEEARLFTDEEFRVNDAVTPRPGERRYQLLGQCVAAQAAAPR
jgi:hypothetical protein